MQERKQLKALFQRYQQGLVNEEEKTMIARWLVQLELMGENLTPLQLQAKAELSKTELKNYFFAAVPPKAKTIKLPIWLKTVAASLFIAIILGSIFYANQHKSQTAQQVFEQTITRIGEMKIITLTDGSKITLNNQSRLSYPARFNGKTRAVYLSGEAFFDIKHDPKKPFLVHTDKLKIQVLGTSFNVSAYSEDKEISVAVATGKVGIMTNHNKKSAAHFLLPGEQLSYNRNDTSFNGSKLAISEISSWNTGKLIFRNETLEDITKQLQRYYKVKFLFKNSSLLSKQISLKTNNQQFATLMRALSLSGDFSYKIEGSQITLW